MHIAIVVLALAAFGCKKKESASSTGTGSGSAVSSNPAKPHHAGNCPSTVARSATSVALDGSNVAVTITSDDPDAIVAVQKRTDDLLAVHLEHHTDTGTEHQRNGEHGGAIGMCPVYIPEGATATGKHLTNGVVVAIAAKDAAALKTEIDARIQRAADWAKTNIPAGDKNQGGVGGGKNNEGMNHSGKGDGKGLERKHGDGSGGGAGSGGGGGKGTGGGSGGGGSGSAATPK
ncbi:MAG: hypothetical protein ABI591_12440 [Kofleriaceae bacterium]